MKIKHLSLVALVMLALSACGTEPIQQDQPITLQAGQGLAAVVYDVADPLSQVTLESAESSTQLQITAVPVGVHVYLFQVPAGSYCFTSFQFGRWHFFSKDKEGQCFQVKAGELGYGGTLSPRVVNGEVMTGQDMDLERFRSELTQSYPIIAKQFLPPEVKEYTAADLNTPASTSEPPVSATAAVPASITPRQVPAASTDQITEWIEYIPGTLDHVVFFRNNTQWTMQVKRFELYDCVAVKACGVQKFTLVIPPHAIRQAMIIEPADPHDAYTYRTRYIYGFVQNGKH